MRLKNYIPGILLLIAAVAITGFLCRTFLQDKAHKETLNGNCKIDPDFVTAVLIDDTDPISIERDEAAAFILKLAEDAPRYSRFVLYRLSESSFENGGKPVPAQETCNPFGKTDRADFLKEDKTELKRERDKFLREIKKITEALLNVKEKPYSPIMEGIHSVAVAEFFSLKSEAKRHLVIVSDMMQNTKDFSMFSKKQQKDFERFKRRPYYRRIKTKALENAQVSVFELVRNSEAQNDDIVLFWKDYFNDQKAEADFVR